MYLNTLNFYFFLNQNLIFRHILHQCIKCNLFLKHLWIFLHQNLISTQIFILKNLMYLKYFKFLLFFYQHVVFRKIFHQCIKFKVFLKNLWLFLNQNVISMQIWHPQSQKASSCTPTHALDRAVTGTCNWSRIGALNNANSERFVENLIYCIRTYFKRRDIIGVFSGDRGGGWGEETVYSSYFTTHSIIITFQTKLHVSALILTFTK
jgi:hypothetical protein